MAQSTPDTVVYVSNAGTKEIYVLAMNRDSGELDCSTKSRCPAPTSRRRPACRWR